MALGILTRFQKTLVIVKWFVNKLEARSRHGKRRA